VRRSIREPDSYMEWTAPGEACVACGGPLQVLRHRRRSIERLDGLLHLVRRDKRCPDSGCPNEVWYRPPEDLRLALPKMTFGLDVVLSVGDRHMRLSESLSGIGRDLVARGIPINQTHVGRLARCYLSLAKCARGDDEAVVARLRQQGGILLMADGVQHDLRSPVLYMVWDALSGTPLFAERREARATEDLVTLLERVKAMKVRVIGVVSDKEKGLVPAVAEVFPDVPHQLCQTHFLKNCAEPLQADLTKLGESVARRAKDVQKIGKKIDRKRSKDRPLSLSTASPLDAHAEDKARLANEDNGTAVIEPIDETDLARNLADLVRENARRTGRAPLNPPELVRHEKLELVRAAVEEARAEARSMNRAHELEDARPGGKQGARSDPAPRRTREGASTRLA
jgi:hypothetical protein